MNVFAQQMFWVEPSGPTQRRSTPSLTKSHSSAPLIVWNGVDKKRPVRMTLIMAATLLPWKQSYIVAFGRVKPRCYPAASAPLRKVCDVTLQIVPQLGSLQAQTAQTIEWTTVVECRWHQGALTIFYLFAASAHEFQNSHVIKKKVNFPTFSTNSLCL